MRAPLVLIASIVTSAATADTLHWTIVNRSPWPAQVSFFAARRHMQWPGPGRGYDLFDQQPRTYPLSCLHGEKICYGAYEYGSHRHSWGVGFNNARACANCCYSCSNATVGRTLDP